MISWTDFNRKFIYFNLILCSLSVTQFKNPWEQIKRKRVSINQNTTASNPATYSWFYINKDECIQEQLLLLGSPPAACITPDIITAETCSKPQNSWQLQTFMFSWILGLSTWSPKNISIWWWTWTSCFLISMLKQTPRIYFVGVRFNESFLFK